MRRLFIIISLSFVALTVLIGGFIVLSKEGEFLSFEYSMAENLAYVTSRIIINNPENDIGNQEPLANPPEIIKAIYATSWTAGTQRGMDRLIKLINETELNAIVIDIKDYSGTVSYDIQVPEVLEYSAKEVRTPRINTLIKRLHDNEIYVIGRLTVFQDSKLAEARPDLAVRNIETGEIWRDRKGIGWIDPASQEAWDYNILIAKDALDRGFDEINFDYIRFPSDGDLSLMDFPFYNPETTYKKDAMRDFFRYLRRELEGHKISADFFGYTATNFDDLGIGQVIEHAYESFDYVAPMIYPSHYNVGFLGHSNPAKAPYEIVEYSMSKALERLVAWNSSQVSNVNGQMLSSKLRPWLQDFDLGGVPYGKDEVLAQIRAVEELYSEDNLVQGWMLWDPRNIYTAPALKPE